MAFFRHITTLPLGSALALLLAAAATAQQPQAPANSTAPSADGFYPFVPALTAAPATHATSATTAATPAAPAASATHAPAAPAISTAPSTDGFYPYTPAIPAAPVTSAIPAAPATPATPAAPDSPLSATLPALPAFPAPAPATAPAIQAPAASPGGNIDLRYANGIIAVVEDQPITNDDVRLEISSLIPQIQREATSQQDFENKIQALQDDIIQNHIDRALIVKDFYKEKEGQPKKSIPASYIDNALSENIITQFDNDRSKFLAYLRAKGQTIREYRKDLEEDMINGYMRQQQQKSQSVVSPVKVQTFYDENKDKFYQDDQVHLRLIQFNRNGQTDDELRAQANEVLNRLKNGEKFEDIAKEVSQDTKRSKGGDWGWQKRTDLKPELSAPLFALKKGEVTNPILMTEGAFLMYVEDRKYAGIQPLEDVRDQIEKIILLQMGRSSQEQWLERLRRDGYVKYYDQ